MPKEKSINILLKAQILIQSSLLLLSLMIISACQPISSTPLQRWQHAIEGSYAGSISADSRYSVTSSIHHGISLWDITNNSLKFNWFQKKGQDDNLVLLLNIAHNGSHVLSASRQNFALWNTTTGQSEGYWHISDANIRDIALSNNAQHLLIGQSNGSVIHVTMKNGRRLEFLGHKEKINTLDLLPNGRVAISGGNDFNTYVWDTLSGQVIYHFPHNSRVSKVALDPQGRYAFSADSMHTANIWDLKTGERISQLQGTKRHEVFSTVRFSPDGQTLVTGAANRKVSLWHITSGERLATWFISPKEAKRPTGAVVYSVAFRDNDSILTESSSGYMELWPMPKTIKPL